MAMVDKSILETLINKNYTRKQIADELNIGYSTVYKYTSRYGLKIKKRENSTIDSKWLCVKCDETDALNFYKGSKSYCKSCANIATHNKIRDNKKKAVEYKGGQCITCGYKKVISGLEFHHTNPLEKDPTWRVGWSWNRLKTELDKCVLLCALCHREEHESISAHGTTG